MPDLKIAFQAMAALIYPITKKLPFRVEQFDTAQKAGVFFDKHSRLQGITDNTPDPPLLVAVYRGFNDEPIVMLHAKEFMSMLKRLDWGAEDGD